MVKSYCVKQKKQTECVEPSGYKTALALATLYHKKLISKNLERVEMSLTGVLGAIFETEEEEENE